MQARRPAAEAIAEASMVVYHRWRAFLPHDAARLKALQFARRCRSYAPPCLPAVAATLAPDAGRTPREIKAALPDVPRSAVYEALALLVRNGRATHAGEIGNRRYFSSGDAP
jgi:hypothetical protein